MKKNNKFMKSFVVLCAFMLAMLSTSMLFKEIAWNKGSLIAWTNYAEDPVLNELTGNYEIHTPEQLAGLAKKVNAGTTYEGETIELCANLDLKGSSHNSAGLNWVPIGTSSKPFQGTFDGRKYTIENLNILNTDFLNVGLFGCIKAATLMNISINGKSYSHYEDLDDYIYSGGLVGYVLAGTSKIELCSSNVAVMGGRYTGGLVGYSKGTLTISKSQNLGPIYSNDYALCALGGIIGYGAVTVDNCNNIGQIFCLSTDAMNADKLVGGIVGWTTGNVSNCSNTGDVFACANISDDVFSESSSTISIASNLSRTISTPFGDIKTSVSTDIGTAGGIGGRVIGNITYCYSINNKVYAPTLDLFDCEDAYAGGIAGIVEGDVSNCYTSSDVFCNSYEYTETAVSTDSSFGTGDWVKNVYKYELSDFHQDPIVANVSGTVSNCYYMQDMVFDGISAYVSYNFDGKKLYAAYRNVDNKCLYSTSFPYSSISIGSSVNRDIGTYTLYDYYRTETNTGQIIVSAEAKDGFKVIPFGGGGGDGGGGGSGTDFGDENRQVHIVIKAYKMLISTSVSGSLVTFACGFNEEEFKDNKSQGKKDARYTNAVYTITNPTYKGALKSSDQLVLDSLGTTNWAIDDSINGGKPYLKSQYWLVA